jgi:mannosyltransferase
MAIDTAPPPRSPAPALGEPAGQQRSSGRLARLRHVSTGWPAVTLFLVVLTAASVVLRTRQMSFLYWVDEGISVGIASHPLHELPRLLREDGSPPLYYALLHVWMSVFGRTEVATHWLSEVFAILTIPAAFWSGTRLFGRRTGVFCAVLAAGVPFLTNYAQETRMYSLLLLLSLLVAMSFVAVFIERRRRYLPLFGLSLVASLYTHNWALFLGLATFIAYLVCLWAAPRDAISRRDLIRDGVIGFGITAVLYLPWVPTLFYQAQHTGAPWALPPVFWSLTTAFYFIAGGRGAAMTILLAAGVGLVALWRPLAAAWWPGRGWAPRGASPAGPPAPSSPVGSAGHGPAVERDLGTLARATVALLILGLGTLLIAWVYAKTTPAWAGRYLAVIVGPLILVFGLGLARARGLGIVALIFVCLFWSIDPRATARDAKSNVGLVAAAMRHHVGATTLVLSTQPEQVPDIHYYLPQIRDFATPLGRVPDPGVVDWRNALERFRHSSYRTVLAPMIDALRPGQRVLLIVPEIFQKAPDWMVYIHRSSVHWESYLKHDRRLRLIKDTSPRQFESGLPVRGLLFVVRQPVSAAVSTTAARPVRRSRAHRSARRTR